MALLQEVEELLKDYSETDQKVLRAHYEANPQLQEKVKTQMLAQRDYSRNIQTANTLKKEAETEKKKYEELYTKNTEWFRDSEAEHQALEQERNDLKAKLTAAEKRVGAPPEGSTPAELTKLFEDFKTLQKAHADTQKALDDSKKELAGRLNNGGWFMAEMDDLADQYRDEFGERFSRKDFLKFMNEKNVSDPNTAYKDFILDKKVAKDKADTDKALLDARADERKKVEAELAGKIGVPYSTGGTFNERGPLQQFIKPEDKAPKSTTEAISAAAQELISEGKY